MITFKLLLVGGLEHVSIYWEWWSQLTFIFFQRGDSTTSQLSVVNKWPPNFGHLFANLFALEVVYWYRKEGRMATRILDHSIGPGFSCSWEDLNNAPWPCSGGLGSGKWCDGWWPNEFWLRSWRFVFERASILNFIYMIAINEGSRWDL